MIYFRDQKNPRLEEATLRLLYNSLGVTSSVTSQLCIQSYFTMTLLYILLYTDSTFSNDDSKCQIQASEWIHNKLTFVENDRAPKGRFQTLFRESVKFWNFDKMFGRNQASSDEDDRLRTVHLAMWTTDQEFGLRPSISWTDSDNGPR